MDQHPTNIYPQRTWFNDHTSLLVTASSDCFSWANKDTLPEQGVFLNKHICQDEYYFEAIVYRSETGTPFGKDGVKLFLDDGSVLDYQRAVCQVDKKYTGLGYFVRYAVIIPSQHFESLCSAPIVKIELGGEASDFSKSGSKSVMEYARCIWNRWSKNPFFTK